MTEASERDLVGSREWDQRWAAQTSRAAQAVEISDDPILHALTMHVGGVLGAEQARLAGRSLAVTEIGCADSAWLGHLDKCGHRVTGIDYSPAGCERARARLAVGGAQADIRCMDAFAPASDLHGTQDAVLSFGVVEHFEDTAGTLRTFARFLRPGGVLLTMVPNIAGAMGWLQRHVDRHCYDEHVPLRIGDLERAARVAGLAIIRSEPLLGFSTAILNAQRHRGTPAYYAITAACVAVNAAARYGNQLPGGWLRGEYLSPYLFSVARQTG